MAKLLTGKEVAQKMDADIQKDVAELKAKGINPTLKIMIVGDAADSLAYANSAKKMAEKNGIACDIEQLPGTTSQDVFIDVLKQRNADKKVHGIIVMRPCPNKSAKKSLNISWLLKRISIVLARSMPEKSWLETTPVSHPPLLRPSWRSCVSTKSP